MFVLFRILFTKTPLCSSIEMDGSVYTMNKGPDADVGIMTVHDVAGYLCLSEAKVYRMENERQAPALRMGNSWRLINSF
jgi:excisionase family DNA binding protein